MQCGSPMYTFPMLMLQNISFSCLSTCTQNMLCLQVCLLNCFHTRTQFFFSILWVRHGSSMMRFWKMIRPSYTFCHNYFVVIRTCEIFLIFTHCGKSSMLRPSEACRSGIPCQCLPPSVCCEDILFAAISLVCISLFSVIPLTTLFISPLGCK